MCPTDALSISWGSITLAAEHLSLRGWGSGSPQRTATVRYDPGEFIGTESFAFEVCDAAAPTECATASMTVHTNERRKRASDAAYTLAMHLLAAKLKDGVVIFGQ